MENNLKVKPFILKLIIPNPTWVTIYPNIYAPFVPNITTPTVWKAIVEHELVHIRQQKEMGLLKWLFKYLSNKKFRLDQEVEAFIQQLKFEPVGHHERLINMFAADLSGKPYHKAASSKQEAIDLIRSRLV